MAVTVAVAPRILVCNASPRAGGHTAQLLRAAAQAFPTDGSFTLEYCQLGSTTDHESPTNTQMADAWLAADGILLGAPVYTFGAPAPLYAFFQCLQRRQAETPAPDLPTPVAIIAQGGGAYTGAEVTAQSLLQQVLSVGGLPVSGDAPGASQGVIGQAPDAGGPAPALLESSRRLGIRLAEMCRILAAGRHAPPPRPPRVLGVVAAAGRRAEAQELLAAALAGAGDYGPIQTGAFDVDGLSIAPCQACTDYCSAHLECLYDDGMQELRRRVLDADAVAWVVEAQAGGPDPAVRAAIDRMNQVRFETHFALRQAHMPRRLQAVGTLALGSDPGSIAGALQFFAQHALQSLNVPVQSDGVGLADARQLGRRLARLAGALGTGVAASDLPEEYHA